MVIERFPARILELVMDGAYASKAWRGLPERVSVTTRMRSNARVHALPPAARAPGQMGRTPLKGAKLPTLAEIAKTALFRAVTITGPDGRERTAHIHKLTCLWYAPFHTRPVKVILIRNPGTTERFDVAIASTDTDTATPELIARYDSRWTIETAPTKRPRPTASGRLATGSRRPCSAPSRSASSRRASRSRGTPSTATRNPT